MRKGSCQCGDINYQFTGEPLTCYTCHCTDCQTSSGSAFTLSMIAKLADISITKGEISVNTYVLNGSEVKRHHCGNCGTTFWYSADSMAEFCAIKPGTFEDTKWFKPIAQLWLRSAQPWVPIDPDLPQYETQPEMAELMNLWVQRETA